MSKSYKIIDMHCDTLLDCWRNSDRKLRDGKGHLNLELMKENGGMAQFFAIYISREETKDKDAYDVFKEVYESYKQEMAANADIIKPAYSAADIIKNDKDGKMSAFLTIENGIFVDGKIERIQEVYDMISREIE
jgi:Zn-dependent dipeptidase, microsomal dipeptidase homolog